MPAPTLPAATPCDGCRTSEPLGFEFTMAFQPIVDAEERRVFAYEALVRGKDGSGAASILAQVTDANRYRFDQACRTTAVELAAALEVDCVLNINFMPNAVYEPATCIQATLAAARRTGFPPERLMFEFSEREQIVDREHIRGILLDYRERGFATAIDDFGAGFSGLGLLVDFQPDIIKVDMAMVRGIDADPVRQAVVRGIVGTARDLKIAVVAEGIETVAEYRWLRENGVRYLQGYLLARPEVERLPEVTWPSEA